MTRTPSAALAQGFSNIGHSYSHILTLLYPTVVLALERSWGLSYGELITLMLAGQILFGAGALPAGWLGDRWSMVGMMIVFFIGTGLTVMLTGFARNPFEVALGLALTGLLGSIYHPVGLAWLIRTALSRGKALGFNGMFGAVGVALGPLIAGVLTDLISWRAAFIVPGASAVLIGLALLVAWRLGWVVESKLDLKPVPEPSRENTLRAFFVLSITMLCAGLVGNSMAVILPKLFADRLGGVTGGSPSVIGTLVTAAYLAAAFAQYYGGVLADRFPLRSVYLVAFALQTPTLFMTAWLDSWPLLFMAMTMVFLSTGALAAENGLLALYTPGKWRATAYGAKFVLAIGVSASCIPLAGYIHDRNGDFFWLFVILGCAAMLVVSVGLLLPSEGRRAKETTLARPVAGAAE